MYSIFLYRVESRPSLPKEYTYTTNDIPIYMFTRTLCRLRHDFFLRQSKKAYPTRAPKTNNIQTNIHAVMAFIPSALGDWVVTVLKILMSKRNKVINMAIRPRTTSGGTRKLTHDTTTNSPANKNGKKGKRRLIVLIAVILIHNLYLKHVFYVGDI